jgi:hypothetical protein
MGLQIMNTTQCKTMIVWDVTFCSLVGGILLSLQGSNLKIEAICSSETLTSAPHYMQHI